VTNLIVHVELYLYLTRTIFSSHNNVASHAIVSLYA